MNKKINSSPNPETFSDVAVTSLLTLYGRALESRTRNPIFVDRHALAVTEKLNPVLADSKVKLLRRLAAGRLDPRLGVHIALRSQQYDDYVRQFLATHTQGVVVNIGCGMDMRFERVDDGRLLFFDLDLPEVISLKKQYVEENERYHLLACSVFEKDWMEGVLQYGPRPVLFLAEGVFMYLDPTLVRDLVLTLCDRFKNTELVFETVKKGWTEGFMKKMVSFKMQKQLFLGPGTEYRFGIADKRALESWHPGLKFIDDWSYFDTDHAKLGWMRLFKDWPFMRDTQYTVRYSIN